MQQYSGGDRAHGARRKRRRAEGAGGQIVVFVPATQPRPQPVPSDVTKPATPSHEGTLAIVEKIRAYGRPLTAKEVEQELALRKNGAYRVPFGRFAVKGNGIRWDHVALAQGLADGAAGSRAA